MGMEREMLDRAIEERLHHRLGVSVPPHPPALGDQREDGRQPALEHGLVERALVAEVVVEARLVLEPRPRRDLPHRDAGVPALGELALGDVEDELPRRRCLARERAWHRGRLTEQTFVCKAARCGSGAPARLRSSAHARPVYVAYPPLTAG